LTHFFRDTVPLLEKFNCLKLLTHLLGAGEQVAGGGGGAAEGAEIPPSQEATPLGEEDINSMTIEELREFINRGVTPQQPDSPTVRVKLT
jgi:hypothetical protein